MPWAASWAVISRSICPGGFRLALRPRCRFGSLMRLVSYTDTGGAGAAGAGSAGSRRNGLSGGVLVGGPLISRPMPLMISPPMNSAGPSKPGLPSRPPNSVLRKPITDPQRLLLTIFRSFAM